MFRTNFENCPHYSKTKKSSNRIKKLEDGHEQLFEFMRDLKDDNKEIKDDNKRQWAFVKTHMEEEGIHHKNTKEALKEMTLSLDILITDKQDRDTKKDRREKWKDIVSSGVAIVVILGIGKLIFYIAPLVNAMGIE